MSVDLNFLGISFLLLSLVLFFYGISGTERCIKSFIIAIAVNCFPLIVLRYYGNESARLGGIPIGYFPLLAALGAAIFSARLRFTRKDLGVVAASIVLLAYLFVQSSLLVGDFDSFILYFSMLGFYLLAMLALSTLLQSLSISQVFKLIELFVAVIAFSILMGLLRYFLNFEPRTFFHDANFLPLFNRNSTALLLIASFPLIGMLRDMKKISFARAGIYVSVYVVGSVFLQSRLGLTGLVLVGLCYVLVKHRFRFRTLLLGTFFLGFFYLILINPLSSRVATRMDDVFAIAGKLYETEGALNPYDSEYKRIRNLSAGVGVVQENFWFGTGMGLTNYLRELERLYPRMREDDVLRSHNLYVSYSGEFGFIGLLLLLFFFFRLWRTFNFYQKKRMKLIEPRNAFNVMLFMIFVSFFFHEFFNSPLLWFFLGTGLGITAHHEIVFPRKIMVSPRFQRLRKFL